MADCTISVEWVKKPTYSDVKKLYECFEYVVTQMAYESISLHFNFKCGVMQYVVESIEEFTETAFGETDFELTALQFLAYLPDKNSVRINYLCALSVSASSKVLLEAFNERLNLEMSFEGQQKEKNNTNSNAVAPITTPTNNARGAMNSPITITGSGNVINVAAGSISGNQIEIEQKQTKMKDKPNGFKNFVSGVIQGVAGNAVWYILGLIGAAIISYFVF
ncbi:hypothetical protein MR626_07345 [bacterium]|nr:hypothetical protein [bacterium]